MFNFLLIIVKKLNILNYIFKRILALMIYQFQLYKKQIRNAFK